MQKDFHFYMIYALAKTAGFSREHSYTIAYASQYVDDNNESQYPEKDGQPQFPSQIRMNGGHFRPIMTQSLSVKSIIYEIQKFVYVPFHFLPGDNGGMIKGKSNRYSTTPNSANARRLVKGAFKSRDLYRIGIALHTYADTWSHQNFTGYEEDWNSVFVWHSPYRAIVPNIGHADVGHYPDEISTDWKDERLEKSERKINNRKRTIEATKHIYQLLRSATKGEKQWSRVEKDFRRIIKEEDYDDRLESIKDYVNEPELYYQKDKWVDEAINREKDELTASADFEKTDWYKFQSAAKAHLAVVVDMLKGY